MSVNSPRPSPIISSSLVPTPPSHDYSDYLSLEKFDAIIKCISAGVDVRTSNGSLTLVANTAKIPLGTLCRWIRYGKRAISKPEEHSNQNPLYRQLVLELDAANINLGQRIFTKLTNILLHGEVTEVTQYALCKTQDEHGAPITYRKVVGYTETRKPATQYLAKFLDNMEPGKWFPERIKDGEHVEGGIGGGIHQHTHHHYTDDANVKHQELDLDSCPLWLKQLLLKYMQDGDSDIPEGLKNEIELWCGET